MPRNLAKAPPLISPYPSAEAGGNEHVTVYEFIAVPFKGRGLNEGLRALAEIRRFPTI
jgi:hypothetical protein